MTREERSNLIDKLEQLRFFNQRVGRELWSDKSHEIQDKDIENTDAILEMAISALSEKRPKGEWLLIGHDDTCNFYKCSFCGYEEHDNFTKHHKFCPNCGADMRGEIYGNMDNTQLRIPR